MTPDAEKRKVHGCLTDISLVAIISSESDGGFGLWNPDFKRLFMIATD